MSDRLTRKHSRRGFQGQPEIKPDHEAWVRAAAQNDRENYEVGQMEVDSDVAFLAREIGKMTDDEFLVAIGEAFLRLTGEDVYEHYDAAA